MKKSNRRNFVRTSLLAGAGLGLMNKVGSVYGAGLFRPLGNEGVEPGKRVGIIGLDTSHVPAITSNLNNPKAGSDWHGYRVVAAYPTNGSADMKESIGRLAGFTEKVKKDGVEIVNSIDELLTKVDVVFLESVDGRRHLAEALPVLKARKRMFIDKPIAASLADAMVIFDAAKKYNVPIFSASSLRYLVGMKDVREGKLGKILGADSYGNCYIEPHHPDLVYYGIHGVEILYALMGTGCKSVVRVHVDNTDMVVGTWNDGRLGSYRGTRNGTGAMGGRVFGEKGIEHLTESPGYEGLWAKVIEFFDTGVPPVSAEETLEEFAFMEAADESKINGNASVELQTVIDRAKKKAAEIQSKIS